MVKVISSNKVNGYKVILFKWKNRFHISVDDDYVLQDCIGLRLAEKRMRLWCEILEDLPYSKVQKDKRTKQLEWELFKRI